MSTWKIEITACFQTLGEVEIKRVIFQGNILSPLIFVKCMVLRKMKAGYVTDIVKINNLLFMDYLELFSKNEKEITA